MAPMGYSGQRQTERVNQASLMITCTFWPRYASVRCMIQFPLGPLGPFKIFTKIRGDINLCLSPVSHFVKNYFISVYCNLIASKQSMKKKFSHFFSHLSLHRYSHEFSLKIKNGSNGVFRAQGKLICAKKPEAENLVSDSL